MVKRLACVGNVQTLVPQALYGVRAGFLHGLAGFSGGFQCSLCGLGCGFHRLLASLTRAVQGQVIRVVGGARQLFPRARNLSQRAVQFAVAFGVGAALLDGADNALGHIQEPARNNLGHLALDGASLGWCGRAVDHVYHLHWQRE